MTAREVLQRLVDACEGWNEYVNSYAAARAYLAQPEPQDEAVYRMRQELRRAQIKLRDREHKADMSTHEPAEVLATLGFWPECGCGECYAIFCLEQTLAKYHTALAAQDKENEK